MSAIFTRDLWYITILGGFMRFLFSPLHLSLPFLCLHVGFRILQLFFWMKADEGKRPLSRLKPLNPMPDCDLQICMRRSLSFKFLFIISRRGINHFSRSFLFLRHPSIQVVHRSLSCYEMTY